MATTDLLIHKPVVGCSPHVEEELPMTMQIGMIGTDGVLIASDKVHESGIGGARRL